MKPKCRQPLATVPDKPGWWNRLVVTRVFVDDFGHLAYYERGEEAWLDNAEWAGPCARPKNGGVSSYAD